MTSKTTQLAKDLTLDNFGSDETALARELAERIQKIHSKKASMTASQSATQTKSGKSANRRMTFNPLHPSMELPPEQLIRLMSMHAQQLTKEARKSKSKHQKKIAAQATQTEPVTPSLAELEYCEEEGTAGYYKKIAVVIIALLCVTGYFVLKYMTKEPAESASIQPAVQESSPVPAPTVDVIQQQPAGKPVTAETPEKPVSVPEKPVSKSTPQPVLPAITTESPDNKVNTEQSTATPDVENVQETENIPASEDSIDTNSEDLVSEPESGILPTHELKEETTGYEPEDIGIEEITDVNLNENTIIPENVETTGYQPGDIGIEEATDARLNENSILPDDVTTSSDVVEPSTESVSTIEPVIDESSLMNDASTEENIPAMLEEAFPENGL